MAIGGFLFTHESNVSLIENVHFESRKDINKIIIYNDNNSIFFDMNKYKIFNNSGIVYYWIHDEKHFGLLIKEHDCKIYKFDINNELFIEFININ